MAASDRPFLLIGGSGGVGSAVARRLVAAGNRVVIASRDTGRLQQVAGELGIEFNTVDATSSASVDELFATVQRDHGAPIGVAHCVGSILLKSAIATSDEEWRQTMSINLDSAFYVLRAAVRSMVADGGSVVLVSSAAARVGLANHEAIAAAKAGVQGLVLAAAASHARRGIRVNAVAPGLLRTPLTSSLLANEGTVKFSTALHALGRLGHPDDVASAICWLLDPAQSWVTGQVIGVDGGLGTLISR
ncbi:MAG: SDR family NAD(P)-dependent oxidoreductase [Limisphaerales bacterium]